MLTEGNFDNSLKLSINTVTKSTFNKLEIMQLLLKGKLRYMLISKTSLND